MKYFLFTIFMFIGGLNKANLRSVKTEKSRIGLFQFQKFVTGNSGNDIPLQIDWLSYCERVMSVLLLSTVITLIAVWVLPPKDI